ncbi:hypothetical protein HPB47_027324 [Ixodes persulcatus]|uniref:Uncharacterized protein n=1 Tax=Ixodes persulcatus TaxID=34615 RepID=A0AC60PWR0_IXOPE|nr:hypothetical protein HPB47_027324 [Ixodes persulcatus]
MTLKTVSTSAVKKSGKVQKMPVRLESQAMRLGLLTAIRHNMIPKTHCQQARLPQRGRPLCGFWRRTTRMLVTRQHSLGRTKQIFMAIAGDVVLRLVNGLEKKNHKIYADNLFTSVPLIRKLKEDDMWYSGTCRANRLDGASGKLKPMKELKAEGRGSSSVCTSTDNITITRWFDNSLVHIASSYVGREPNGDARRYNKKYKEVLDVLRPHSVKTYNEHMGGVDLMDSMVARYRNDVRNKRGYYMRIFYHLVNVAIVNAWFIWKLEGHPAMDLLEFRSRVAKALIYGGEAAHSAKKRGRPPGSSPLQPVKKRAKHDVPLEKRLDGGAHYPRKMTLKNAQRCRSKNCRSKTRYTCGRCDVPLCPECFEEFHAS